MTAAGNFRNLNVGSFCYLYDLEWTESPHRSFSCRLNLIMRDTERAMAISIMRKSTDVPP